MELNIGDVDYPLNEIGNRLTVLRVAQNELTDIHIRIHDNIESPYIDCGSQLFAITVVLINRFIYNNDKNINIPKYLFDFFRH